MVYANGGYYHVYRDDTTIILLLVFKDVGYEGVRSFTIATTKVTNEVVQYWLDKQSLYAPGAMKAAYGTFLTSLLIIKCHDMVADQAATAYNVTWSRTTPVVVSHCDDAASTYITGESDLRMGMDVNGTLGNVWAFRFACSSAFSPMEEEVGGTNNTGIGSVTLGIGERILQGETPELFYSNGYIIYKMKDKDDMILALDPKTGIVTDIMDNACVVYCYHNQMTEQRIDQAEDIISGDPSKIQSLNSISNSTIMLGSFAAIIGTSAETEGTFLALGTISLEAAMTFTGVIVIIAAPIIFLQAIQPYAIEEAEQEGNFNTAEYLRNNNLQDQMWDVMFQWVGMSLGPPQGVWDESYKYGSSQNPNVRQNLEDIKNMKESARALWDGALELFLTHEQTRMDKKRHDELNDFVSIKIGFHSIKR